MRFEFDFRQPQMQPQYRAVREGPLRILLLGDFSGRSNRGLLGRGEELAARPIVPVDVDNLDTVMGGYAPRLHLAWGGADGPTVAVEFQGLEDFHPDRLYERLELFQELRETRRQLLDPATFQGKAEELRSVAHEAAPARPEPGAVEDDGATLERLLGKHSAEPSPARARPGERHVDISRFIQRLVQPHISPEAGPEQDHLVGAVDLATGEQMRALVHDPAFQTLEAAWRQVHWLVTSLETGESLRLYLVDVTKDELAADLSSVGGQLESSGLFRLLERGSGTADHQPWSVLAGHYMFGASSMDAALLAGLGSLAACVGAPWLGGAHPDIVGCESLLEAPEPSRWRPTAPEQEENWGALRTSPVARWIGLALPRVLLRLPYGPGSDEIERFAFRELLPGHGHEAYLWGNPAFACALLLGMAFLEKGWAMEPGDFLELGDLPAHVSQKGDEATLQACGEVFLTERASEAILARGVMPLISYKNRNAVRLLRFQSVADPPASLAGPWA